MRDGVQTCALPIYAARALRAESRPGRGALARTGVEGDPVEQRNIAATLGAVSRSPESARCLLRRRSRRGDAGYHLCPKAALFTRGRECGLVPRRSGRSSHRARLWRSEEHTSELQSLMRISYAVFCLKKKNNIY